MPALLPRELSFFSISLFNVALAFHNLSFFHFFWRTTSAGWFPAETTCRALSWYFLLHGCREDLAVHSVLSKKIISHASGHSDATFSESSGDSRVLMHGKP